MTSLCAEKNLEVFDTIESISDRSISTIYKTSGLVEAHAPEIAKTMYILLFDLFPSYKEFFKNAPSHQHELLSETIASYAVNISNLKILMPAFEKIARTHVKVGVKPENYKVIKKMMLLSFKVVLKDQATDEMMASWNEAITFVSKTLIKLESELYRAKN